MKVARKQKNTTSTDQFILRDYFQIKKVALPMTKESPSYLIKSKRKSF